MELNRIFLDGGFKDTEIIIGLVGAVGTKNKKVVELISKLFKKFNYSCEIIKVSKDIINDIYQVDFDKLKKDEHDRISKYMDLGNIIRQDTNDNSILALGIVSKITSFRDKDDDNNLKPNKKTVYIIDSLKHPEEVKRLRNIYTNGFYLISLYSDEEKRLKHLHSVENISETQALELIKRDMNELHGFGQHTRDTFHLGDFFLNVEDDDQILQQSVKRILDLMFGNPFITPTFDEFAMFMAYCSSLRSADLSRQIGAVVTRNKEIISTGANDCPKYGGGLYWPKYCKKKKGYVDDELGRDYMLGYDSNKVERNKIIDNIVEKIHEEIEEIDKEKVRKAILKSNLKHITEYGRVVHAEMEALLSCARNNISTKEAELYCTTFPCHNCAKHIIAAGIRKVKYIEPYPKSKAFEFHKDCISTIELDNKVAFLPFVGVGPRRFKDLFSLKDSFGNDIKRKDRDGMKKKWEENNAYSRIQMLPGSYLDKEIVAMKFYKETIETIKTQEKQ